MATLARCLGCEQILPPKAAFRWGWLEVPVPGPAQWMGMGD